MEMEKQGKEREPHVRLPIINQWLKWIYLEMWEKQNKRVAVIITIYLLFLVR